MIEYHSFSTIYDYVAEKHNYSNSGCTFLNYFTFTLELTIITRTARRTVTTEEELINTISSTETVWSELTM